jgi:glycosyltransferase involved in cell wall biosynthesis
LTVAQVVLWLTGPHTLWFSTCSEADVNQNATQEAPPQEVVAALGPAPSADVPADLVGAAGQGQPGVLRRVAIIPAYNEDKYIAGVVLKARRYVDHVLVVDDGSSDLTGVLAEEVGATVITQNPNQGKGAAVLTGLLWARQAGAEAAVLLDGDGQHNPHDIVRLVQPVLDQEADIVVGSRFIGQEARKNVPRWRQAGQHTLNAATSLGSGYGLTDSQSGYRAFSRRAVEVLCSGLTSKGFTVESEMQFLAREHALRTVEAPIVVDYDVALKRNPVLHGMEVLNGILKLVGQARPLLFISVPGLIMMTLGVTLGLIVVDTYGRTGELAIGYSLLTVLLMIVGVLSLFSGITLHTIRAFFLQLSRRD